MKFYKPVRKQYFYLSSLTAQLLNNGNGITNYYFRWIVPSFFIKNGEVKLTSVNSINVNAGTSYIIRMKSPMCDNTYNSTYAEPILFISRELNDSNLNNSPELRIHNKTINEIIIKVSVGIDTTNNNDTTIDTLTTGIIFYLGLEFTEYEPELTSIEYKVNENQNYNRRIV